MNAMEKTLRIDCYGARAWPLSKLPCEPVPAVPGSYVAPIGRER